MVNTENIEIKKLLVPTNKKTADINRLLRQVSKNPSTLETEDLGRILRQKNTFIYVLSDTKTDEIIGMATAHFWENLTKKKWYIDHIVVEKNYRGMGFGRNLCEQIIKDATASKADYIHLHVDKENKPAKKFYKKLGWRERSVILLQRDL